MPKCMYCEKDESDRDIYERAIYQPFDDEPTTEGYICDYCDDDIVWCDSCDREIYESNGLRKNVRYDYDNDCMECVRCLQERWFVEGMENFKDGDWFLDKDLVEHGFVKHSSYFCDYEKAKGVFIYLKAMNSVIVSITASGMGLEHYYDIWTKEVVKDE